MKKEECIFCKIVKKEIPTDFLFESENFICFLDISPVSKGHTLIVPKKHSTNILEIDTKYGKELLELIQKVGKAQMESLNADGFNIGVNTGKAAGQLVMHTHIHLMPRYNGDGLVSWASTEYETEDEKKEVLQKLMEELNK